MKTTLAKVLTHRDFLKMCGLAALGAGAGQLVQPPKPVLAADQTIDGNLYVTGSQGIGTTSPIAALHIHASTADTDRRIVLTDATTGTTAADGLALIKGGAAGDKQQGWLWNYENAGLHFGTNNLERLTILNSGNVGIGRTNPTSLLHLQGATIPAITITDGTVSMAARVFKAVGYQERLDLSSNVYIDGALTWNLDDTNQPGELIILRSGMFRFFNFSAGTNPRQPTELLKIDAAGNVIVKGVTAINADGSVYYA